MAQISYDLERCGTNTIGNNVTQIYATISAILNYADIGYDANSIKSWNLSIFKG